MATMTSSATSSVAVALAGTHFPASNSAVSRLSVLILRPSSSSNRYSLSPLSMQDDGQRFSSVQVRATSSSEDTSGVQTDELLADLKEKWDAIENKSTVYLYGGGAIIALWLSSVLVGAINSVPLLPKLLELVGLGYTGWFVYRYLLFKQSRKELVEDIEILKKKIAGAGE